MLNVLCVTVAGFSAVHFLVNVPHESRITVPQPAGTSQLDDGDWFAVGLNGLLSCLQSVTDANMFDARGRTPLMCAIIDGRKAAARQLVCSIFSFFLKFFLAYCVDIKGLQLPLVN